MLSWVFFPKTNLKILFVKLSPNKLKSPSGMEGDFNLTQWSS